MSVSRKSVRGTNIESVYQTRLTMEEKKIIQSSLLDIKKLLMYSRKYADTKFAYGTNGAIIAASLVDYKEKLETFLKDRGDKNVQ